MSSVNPEDNLQFVQQLLTSNQADKQSQQEQAKTHAKIATERSPITEDANLGTDAEQEAEQMLSRGVGETQSTLSSAKGSGVEPQTILPSAEGSKKPQLPMSLEQITNVEEASIKSAKGINLIAIMANVMILQAKCNQDFFSSLWQEASAAMNMEAQLAPVVAKATLESGLAQANATRAQAAQSLASGITNLAVFGGTVLVGGLLTAAEPIEDKAAGGVTKALQQTGEDSNVDEDVGETGDDEMIPDETSPTSTPTGPTSDDEVPESEPTERKPQDAKSQPGKDAAKTQDEATTESGSNVLNKLKSGAKAGTRLFRTMQNVMNYGMMGNMIAQGITGVTGSVYQSRQAYYEQLGAEWKAVSEMANVQVQIMGQAFGRAEGMSQQAQQNINTALQVLEGIVQTITQTVNGGFQGL